MDPAICIIDKGTHYEYLIVWGDDILICSKDPIATIEMLEKMFRLKGLGQLEYFLGADMHWDEKANIFTMGSKTCIKWILKQFELICTQESQDATGP